MMLLEDRVGVIGRDLSGSGEDDGNLSCGELGWEVTEVLPGVWGSGLCSICLFTSADN